MNIKRIEIFFAGLLIGFFIMLIGLLLGIYYQLNNISNKFFPLNVLLLGLLVIFLSIMIALTA